MLDKLLVPTGNTVVRKLGTMANDAGFKLLMIRLNMQGGVVIKTAEVDQIKLQKWFLDEAKAQGIDIEGNRVERRQAAAQAAKRTLKTASANPSVALIQLDTDELARTGQLDANTVKTLQIPGAETMRKWVGSAAPSEFNLGVVTAIVQLATFFFAGQDWYKSDQFNHDDNLKKFRMVILSMAGNVIETISGTVEAFEECSHPLSAYIMKDWSRLARFDKVGVLAGRGLGAIAGAVIAWDDFHKNAPDAWQQQEYVLSVLYRVNGALGFYVAIWSLTGAVPGFWPIFLLSIAISIGIAELKNSETKDWISRCKFSAGSHYDSLDAELKAFNSAAG